MHLRKTAQLAAHLFVTIEIVAPFFTGRIQQAIHHGFAQISQPGPRRPLTGLGQLPHPRSRHQRHEAVGQRGGEQRVGVGAALFPGRIVERLIRQAAFIPQPQIHLRHTAQAREQDGVRPQHLGHRFHRLPGEPGEQMGTGPQVGGGTGAGDEGLHRADGERQQRHFAFRVGGKGPGEGGGEIQMLPDGVIRHPRVGGQLLPQLAQRAIVVVLVQFRAEAPESEQAPAQIPAHLFRQRRKMIEAARLDGLDIGVHQTGQIDLLAADRVDQYRRLAPDHLRPLILRPLGTIRRRSPPVGPLDRLFVRLFQRESSPEIFHRPALVAGPVTEQYQRLLARIMQARGEFGLPEFVVVHCRYSPDRVIQYTSGGVLP